MDKLNFFDRQQLENQDMLDLETNVVDALGDLEGDLLLPQSNGLTPGPNGTTAGGVVFGVGNALKVEQAASPNMTVLLYDGVAYTGESPPRRIVVPAAGAPFSVNLAVDLNSAPTIPAAGLYCWVALTVKPATIDTDQRTMVDGVTKQYYRSQESYAVEVIAGPTASSAGAAVPPTIPASNVLLGEWLFSSATTQVLKQNKSKARCFQVDKFMSPKFDIGSKVKDLETLVSQNGVVTIDTPPSMNVWARASRISVGDHLITYADTELTLAAPTLNPYYALVYVDPSTGVPAVKYGAQAASPTAPSFAGVVPLALFYLVPGQTFVDSVYEDVRPFLGMAAQPLQINESRQVAAASQTSFTLPFSYNPNTNQLEAWKNGVHQDSTQITETDSTHVTVPAQAGGEVWVFRAVSSANILQVAQPSFAGLNGHVEGLVVNTGENQVAAEAVLRVEALQIVVGGQLLTNQGQVTVDGTMVAGGGGLVSTTWYYLYGYLNPAGGSQQILFELSTTGPTANGLFKSTDNSRVYLGAYRTNGSAAFANQCRRGREVRYLQDPSSGLTVGSGTGAPQYVSCAALVPPNARFASGLLRQNVAATRAAFLMTPPNTGSSPTPTAYIAQILNTQLGWVPWSGPTDAIQRLYFDGDANANFTVQGFRD